MKAVLRAAARNRVIRKRLPADLGGAPVFCSPDALLSLWKPGWRSEQATALFAWARRFINRGEVVWDIGANQGLFAFAAAAVAGASGHVIAFEPDPFLVALLHRSRRVRSSGATVDILPVAVGAELGIAGFCVARKDRALNHLASVSGNPRTGGERERFAVVSVTLDWAAQHLPAPDLVKVDIEGAELAVLEHAGPRILHGSRPRWIIEVASENAKRVADILHGAGFRLFDVNAPEEEIERAAWNTLAVPAERL